MKSEKKRNLEIQVLENLKKDVLGKINLTYSKSETNRVLIIQALCNKAFAIENISDSQDTKTLEKLLNTSETLLDVGNAGTTMRFLTAYLASKEGSKVTLTGSSRMKERPIGILVEALKKLGAEITYLEKDGYPPLEIIGKKLTIDEIDLDSSISSQFITALLLIAPTLEKGLKINLIGKISSKPYIDMTLRIMKYFGITCYWEYKTIIVEKANYIPKNYVIEGDWSSASYWYAFAVFANKAELFIKGLKKDSLQGDAVIADIMSASFGIKTEFLTDGIRIYKDGNICTHFEYDFSDCPDIAQTVAVVCAGLNISANLTGLESLKIKETDRIEALKKELSKFNFDITCNDNSLQIKTINNLNYHLEVTIETYDDHRMALAFSPLAMIFKKITINDSEVIKKSYPNFWNDLSLILE